MADVEVKVRTGLLFARSGDGRIGQDAAALVDMNLWHGLIGYRGRTHVGWAVLGLGLLHCSDGSGEKQGTQEWVQCQHGQKFSTRAI